MKTALSAALASENAKTVFMSKTPPSLMLSIPTAVSTDAEAVKTYVQQMQLIMWVTTENKKLLNVVARVISNSIYRRHYEKYQEFLFLQMVRFLTHSI
jgi:hypothetical protein